MALRRSSGSGLVSGDGVSVLSFVMGMIFSNSYFRWPFVIAGESGSCLDMRSSVSPVQVVRWKFLIAMMNMEVAGLKYVARSNSAKYFLVLFIWNIALAACNG